MTQCKVNSCKNERKSGASRCQHHDQLYRMRRDREAQFPRCETQGCGNTSRSGEVLCGRCIDIADQVVTRREMTLEERVANLERHVFGE